MNIKFLTIALGLAFMAIAFSASAQKKYYTQGLASYTMSVGGNDVEAKVYFTADSSVSIAQYGPANVKMLTNNKGTYFAILVDVPVASMKKVAVLTPDELEQAIAAAPKFTFTAGTETKQISGFNCKKVTVKDPKSGSTYTAWVTNDVSAPTTVMTKYFADAGGFPVQFTTIQQGQPVDVTLKSVTDEKAPAGTFIIPPGFDKISMDELSHLGGR